MAEEERLISENQEISDERQLALLKHFAIIKPEVLWLIFNTVCKIGQFQKWTTEWNDDVQWTTFTVIFQLSLMNPNIWLFVAVIVKIKGSQNQLELEDL